MPAARLKSPRIRLYRNATTTQEPFILAGVNFSPSTTLPYQVNVRDVETGEAWSGFATPIGTRHVRVVLNTYTAGPTPRLGYTAGDSGDVDITITNASTTPATNDTIALIPVMYD